MSESTESTIDHLTELCDLVEVDSLLTGGVVARGAWRSRGRISDPIKFFALLDGAATLRTDGVEAPVALAPGDVAILVGRSWVELETGEEPRTEVGPESDFASPPFTTRAPGDDVLLGGCVRLNEAGRTLLTGSFPPVAVVRAHDADAYGLRETLLRLLDEAGGARPGAAFAIRQHARLLLLGLLRAYAGRPDLSAGLLRLLTDDRLRPALDRMHAEPARAWRLDELSRAVAMSRTSFAERFRDVAGMPPLAYLTQWRMLLARRALREDDARVGELAQRLGYGSESAFSTAFKRVVGESPLRYRARLRERAADAAPTALAPATP
ncbi:AraC family transcriptional regulator [Cellulosimicrobium composti]|uniref:AraC family transcriptional regulator n=1 Tax=Cellulosimicrobium composti TaxID=2672572 RepID=UPI00193A1825|nr:AraC family transcriptional regulator [Cellulosimicrobium composti]